MNYLLFSLGLLLVCMPGAFVLQRKCRFESLGQVIDKRHLWWAWIHGLNILDLVRAYAGALLIQGAVVELLPEAGGMVVLSAVGGVLAGGMVLQQFFFRTESDELVMPVFFLAGVSLGLVPEHLAALILALGAATAIATRTIGGGCFAAALAAAGMGVMFRGELFNMALVAGLFGGALLISLMLQRTMVLSLSTHRVFRRSVVQGSIGALR